jgi:hypothetical protein
VLNVGGENLTVAGKPRTAVGGKERDGRRAQHDRGAAEDVGRGREAEGAAVIPLRVTMAVEMRAGRKVLGLVWWAPGAVAFHPLSRS